MSIKTALCVATAAFLASVQSDATKIVIQTIDEHREAFDSHVFIQNKPFNLPTTLEDRATCETDDSLLQLLPYIALVNQNDGRVFGYYRGKAGGESKLVGKMSMGVGGHVEEALQLHGDLVTLLVTHAVREVVEEVGYKDPESIRHQLEAQLVKGATLVYQPEDKVGKFHLGIFLSVAVDPELFGELEGGVIERGQWFDFPNPADLEPGDFWEGWTQTLLALAVLGDAKPTTTSITNNERAANQVENTANTAVGLGITDIVNNGEGRANPILGEGEVEVKIEGNGAAGNANGGEGGNGTEVGAETKVETNLTNEQQAGGSEAVSDQQQHQDPQA